MKLQIVLGVLCTLCWGAAYIFLKGVTLQETMSASSRRAVPLITHALYATWSLLLTVPILFLVLHVPFDASDRSALPTTMPIGTGNNHTAESAVELFTQAWSDFGWNNFGYVTGYSLCLLVGAWLYLYAVSLQGASIAVLTSLTSAYPVVTLSYIVVRQQESVNLAFAFPGVLLVLGGCVLLAFSQKVD